MKKLLFLYNPTAGTGRVRARLGEIVDRFIPFGYEVTLHPTQYRGDATEFVRGRGSEFDRVVCAGGDGTLNEVVSGILDLESPPQLGYIPMGSTNDFSRTLKLPGDLLEAADCAVMGTVRKIDVGMLNDRCFIYVAAFGLFTDVSYSTPQNLKNALGHLAYILQGAAQLGNIKTYHMVVECDDQVIEDDFIYGMVSDTISVGGFRGVKEEAVQLDDGRFEVMLVRQPKNMVELNSIIAALIRQEPNHCVLGFQSHQIRFHSQQPVPWTLDGEYGGEHTEVNVEVRQRAYSIVTGDDVAEEILHRAETEPAQEETAHDGSDHLDG